mmetsp:Transcript_2593/g.3890  ORF Transcript_2593/g.3890 Transcript_2593/m.3890 type:complete len:290 (+) Transcript_2593:42-911(+)
MLRQFTSASKRIHSSSKFRFFRNDNLRHGSRPLSSSTPPPSNPEDMPRPPMFLTKEMAFGIQSATELFVRHGLGKQKLKDISKETGDVKTLVSRWQRMMEAYLGTQVHVLAGLGYKPNEHGLQLYNQHVAMYMQNAEPDIQEELRIGTRDLWRFVLATSFNLSTEEIAASEMTIPEARDAMHKVSQKMQSPEILEAIAGKAAKAPPTGNEGMDMAMKHQMVQDKLVHDVYLGGEPSLVEECGFQKGEKGYVLMQCVMAEHQNDPLVSQYVGSAMMRILKSAGIDLPEGP